MINAANINFIAFNSSSGRTPWGRRSSSSPSPWRRRSGRDPRRGGRRLPAARRRERERAEETGRMKTIRRTSSRHRSTGAEQIVVAIVRLLAPGARPSRDDPLRPPPDGGRPAGLRGRRLRPGRRMGKKVGWVAFGSLLYTTVLMVAGRPRALQRRSCRSPRTTSGPRCSGLNFGFLADGLSLPVALVMNIVCRRRPRSTPWTT